MNESDDDLDLQQQLDQSAQWCQPRHPGWETLLERLPKRPADAGSSDPSRPPRPLAGRRGHFRRWAGWAAVAASIGVLVAVSVWRNWPARELAKTPDSVESERPNLPPVLLAAGCRVEPQGEAIYRVVEPRRVQLDRGQLYVEVDRTQGSEEPFVVETPAAEARAVGTRFTVESQTLAANHVNSRNPQGDKLVSTQLSKFKFFTQVLVLAGVVQLVNAEINVEGRSGQVLAAEAAKAPEQPIGPLPVFPSLSRKKVQEEIMLTADQVEKLRQLSKDYQAAMPFGPGRGGEKSTREFYEKYKQRREEIDKKVRDVLMPFQIEKLEAAELQRRATYLLAVPRIAEKVSLTEEQKDRIRTQKLELAEKMAQLQAEYAEKAVKVLTQDQMKKLKDAAGERRPGQIEMLGPGGSRIEIIPGGGAEGGMRIQPFME